MPRLSRSRPMVVLATTLVAATATLTTGFTSPSGAGTTATSGTRHSAPAARAVDGRVPCRDLDTSQPGVTPTAVHLGNVADVTGPVPGLFRSAQQAVEAYVASFNARRDLCGRSVVLDLHDSRTDAARDRHAYSRICEQDLAAVGSMSAFDNGGAAIAEECGLPDLRAGSVTAERRACATCLAVHPTDPATVGRAVPRHLARTAADSVAHAAVIYLDEPSNEAAARAALIAADREGWTVVYTQAVSQVEPSYLPYAQQIEAHGVRLVWFFGHAGATVRLQEAMREWGYVPELFLQDEVIYTPAYVRMAGPNAVGVLTNLPHALVGDRSRPEVRRYRRWLARVHPGARPDGHGLWAWSAAKLALTTMHALGGALGREQLLRALAETRSWAPGGLHPPQQVGTQRESGCELLARRDEDRWRQVTTDGFLCAPLARGDSTRTAAGPT